MPRLRVALLVSFFLVAFLVPRALADSIPIGELSTVVAGGCHDHGCYKTWVGVSINSGGLLYDTNGFSYPVNMIGTFYVKGSDGGWYPAYGDSNIQFNDPSGQMLNLGYICTPCSGLMLKLTLVYPEELLINGKKVYPDTTLTAILLPSNGQYFTPYDYVTATIYLTTTNATPEPSSLLMMGSGLLGLAGVTRRSWRVWLTKSRR